ncbi:MAG: pilus assembly protein [Deltaproteobacteria bacterium]|nr:pilus assembly protein [Deltaproteobacteria bacterium]
MFLRLIRHFSLRRRCQEGVAAVEMALCLLPLLLLLGGIVDFGDAYYIKQVITNASREGARYGSRFTIDSTGNHIIPANITSPYTIAGYVTNYYGGSVTNLTVPTPTGTGYTSGTSGDPLTVTVTAQKNWFFLGNLLGFTNPQTLTATTTMALE